MIDFALPWGAKGAQQQQTGQKVDDSTPEYKIIVVGEAAVGKTAIIHQFMYS